MHVKSNSKSSNAAGLDLPPGKQVVVAEGADGTNAATMEQANNQDDDNIVEGYSSNH